MPYVQLSDGARLFYQEYDFTDPWRVTPAVVLHHGNAKNLRMWYRWIPVLARTYRVFAFDARGFGQSSVPADGNRLTLEHYCHDLLEFLDALQLDKVHLIGESVGGTISLDFALRHGGRLLSVSACGPPYRFDDTYYSNGAALIRREGIRAWVSANMAGRLDPEFAKPDFISWYAEQMMAAPPHVVAGILENAAGLDLSARFAQIRVPTLLMSAGKFANRSSDIYQRLRTLIPGATLEVFPDVRGFVQHTIPERCAERFLAFAARVVAR